MGGEGGAIERATVTSPAATVVASSSYLRRRAQHEIERPNTPHPRPSRRPIATTETTASSPPPVVTDVTAAAAAVVST